MFGSTLWKLCAICSLPLKDKEIPLIQCKSEQGIIIAACKRKQVTPGEKWLPWICCNCTSIHPMIIAPGALSKKENMNSWRRKKAKNNTQGGKVFYASSIASIGNIRKGRNSDICSKVKHTIQEIILFISSQLISWIRFLLWGPSAVDLLQWVSKMIHHSSS